jgi:hypothetical protein
VGSNTVFSFDASNRDIQLNKGSVLFHSPAGKGGGNIKTSGATASVLGTTLIVAAVSNGGIKTMILEGKGQMTTPGGRPLQLGAGQLSFAMPGQKPSPPLNFSIQGQVGTSKLVTGFSKPVASISKIQTAAAKQQSRIASGKLSTTDLVIGDRPDTAFQLDSTTITTVRFLQQEPQRAQAMASRLQPDPRYLSAVKANLQLNDHVTAALGSNIFAIDGSGANKGTSYGLPKLIPGNREGTGTHSALVAESITFGPSGAAYFLATPVDVPSELNHAAIVTLKDLRFERDIEFVGLSAPFGDLTEVVQPDGAVVVQSSEKWRPLTQLLLSVGGFLNVQPGVSLQANVPLFEIFSAGSSYSDGISLSINPPSDNSSSAPVLQLESVGLQNHYASDDDLSTARSGKIRLSAPSVSLRNTGIEAGAIEIVADKALTVTRTASPIRLPLGFNSPEDLTLNAYSVRLQSKSQAVQITGAAIVANKIDISAATDITINNLRTTSDFAGGTLPLDGQAELPEGPSRTFSASAGRNLSIVDSDIQATTNFVQSAQGQATQLLSINLRATEDVIIGNEPAPENPNPLRVIETKTVLTAQEVQITSGGNIRVQGLTMRSADPATSSFSATAANELNLNNVNLLQTQRVALTANTVVLSDLQLKNGSTVALNSATGRVAPNPGNNQSADFRNGMVNFVRNVFYGGTEIKFSTAGRDVDHAGFQQAATAAGKNLQNITIGKK